MILAIVVLIHAYAQNQPERPDIYDYPLDVDLYQIYNILGIDEDWTPEGKKCTRPINQVSFKLIRYPQSLCQPIVPNASEPLYSKRFVDILIVVKSRLTSFDQRNAIRQTWANATCASYLDTSTRTVFALGSTARPQTSLIERLRWEHDTFGDLLQFDFVDSYHNNTYKMMSVLRHISRNCRATRFVVLVDDDFLVHPSNLIRAIQRITTTQYPTYVSGFIYPMQFPERDASSKWHVLYENFPYQNFPPYPSGGTVILSMPVVHLVTVGMPFVKFLWIDDVFLGIILQKYGISPQKLHGVWLPQNESDFDPSNAITVHGFDNPMKMLNGWMKLMQFGACPSRNDAGRRE
ncbi:unnamed protein product [Echinostoma caproni]|uniref:Hexosyltransferase n=1 Tax=Echinostoma caproni TaxID=27848 RepID=A0A183AJ68_9TREM|nr:unnamed protein product [Echinostoma caproni]